MLSPSELARYSRHLALPQFGEEGQEKLKNASVLLVGAGGLGSPAALYLAAAGVGRIGIVDSDTVDISNLQRQILHGTSDHGELKTISAERRLSNLNPEVSIDRHDFRLTSLNALQLLAPYDVIVDGSDNFPTRYLVNDACVLLGKPNVYGSVLRFEGQASVFSVDGGPCYRCVYPRPPAPGVAPSCEEAGVLGVVPGIIGTIQAAETLKLILGIGRTLAGRLLLFDALTMEMREFQLTRNRDCSVCGPDATTKTLIDYEAFCGAAMNPSNDPQNITPQELAERLKEHHVVRLIDVREKQEWDLCHLEGAELIPLAQVPARAAELASTQETVVYCRSGVRSARAAAVLRAAGSTNVRNLAGGINGWAREIDPSMPVY